VGEISSEDFKHQQVFQLEISPLALHLNRKTKSVCFSIYVQQNVILPNGIFEGHGKV
jgi:hypothetical protein